eukprot:403344876
MGMEVTKINGLLCVELDTGSIFSGYSDYIQNFNDSYAQVKYDMSNSLYLQSTVQSTQGNQLTYSKGESIKGYINQQAKRFPLPQSDNLGFCDNSKSPSFLTSIQDQSCLQKVQNLAEVCTTQFNPQNFATSLQYLKGSRLTSNRAVINVNSVYNYAVSTQTISSASSLTLSTPTYDAVTCSCNGAIKEAHYTLFYTPQADGNFLVEDLQVDLILYSSLTLASQYCSTTQVPSTAATSTDGVKRSGNPGYLKGLPLLVSFGDNGGGQRVNTNGFRLYGGDNQGRCFNQLTTNSQNTFSTSIVNFGQDVATSCQVQLTQAQLKSYCQKSYGSLTFAKPTLQIFDQFLTQTTQIGIFGNANIVYSGDWVRIIQDEIHGFLSDSTDDQSFDDTTQTCHLQAGLELNILTSKLGFLEDPQNYVVGARLSGVYDTWKFQTSGATTQLFNHFIQVKFTEVLPDDLVKEKQTTSGLLPKLPSDLFYPLAVQSTAGFAQQISISYLSLLLTACVIASTANWQ